MELLQARIFVITSECKLIISDIDGTVFLTFYERSQNRMLWDIWCRWWVKITLTKTFANSIQHLLREDILYSIYLRAQYNNTTILNLISIDNNKGPINYQRDL